MKALMFTGKGGMELVEKEKPQVKPGHALIKVLASGICGTDTELLLPKEVPNPTVPGHEGVGVVEEAGEGCRVQPGDVVMLDCHITCRKCDFCRQGDVIFCSELVAIGHELDGTNAEYILMPQESLRPLPDDVSLEAGVLIGDALGTPYHAVKKANIKPGDFVSVFGTGPLGTMAVFCASRLGAQVIAVDLCANRLENAKKYGAAHCLNPAEVDVVEQIRRISGGKGADACIQCTPSASALINGLDSLKLRGTLIQVGVCTDVRINPMAQINDREISIIGSRNFNGKELPELLEFVRKYPEVADIVTHRFSLEEAEEAFKTSLSGQCLKVLILPHPEAFYSLKAARQAALAK